MYVCMYACIYVCIYVSTYVCYIYCSVARNTTELIEQMVVVEVVEVCTTYT